MLGAPQCCPALLVLLLIGYAIDCPTYKDLVAKNLDSPEYKKISAQSTRCVCSMMYGVQWLLHPCSPFTLVLLRFHLTPFKYVSIFSSLPLLPLDSPSLPPIFPPPPLFPPLSSRLPSSFPPLPSAPSFFPSPCSFHTFVSPYLSFQYFSVQQKNWTKEDKAKVSIVWKIANVGLCTVCPLPTCHGPHQRYARHWLASPSMT